MKGGRVLAIGRGVDQLKVGDRVLVPLHGFSTTVAIRNDLPEAPI